MIAELALSIVTTMGFGVISLFEHFAQAGDRASTAPTVRSNRPVYALLSLCVIFGNLVIWAPAMFGW
jgi:hypothetical protein